MTDTTASNDAHDGDRPADRQASADDSVGEDVFDRAVATRPPADVPHLLPGGGQGIFLSFVSGFAMGSADLVPGVSGGTVALVIGIYERLVANIRQGAHVLSLAVRADFEAAWAGVKAIEWRFLAPLLLGVLTAVAVLASVLRHLLETQPIKLSAIFFGLIVGSIVIAVDEINDRTPRIWGIMMVSAVVIFLVLGLRSGRFEDPSLLIIFFGGALAICAMILPGISGSFILLMLGLYQSVLDAASDRNLAVIAVFGIGAVLGLGSFATALNWLLDRYRDAVLAALIGLMAGSLRVLWPWPSGEDGVGDTTLGAPSEQVLFAVLAAVLAAAVVIGVARFARDRTPDSDETVDSVAPARG